jgi:Delta3,5-Delta2,4-dienoyl-CoA isomerase
MAVPRLDDMDKDYKYLSVEIPCPHVTMVRLNRPDKLNAIHAGMWREIGHVFGRLEESRCILLTGAGRGFCSGIDLEDLTASQRPQQDVARTGIALMDQIRQMQACFTQLEMCPIPVVVAMHGFCIGAGMDLACCADIRICASNTIFSVREVQMGLAADVGTLQRLAKLTGNASWVSDVCLTARNFKAREAFDRGFVSQIVEDDKLLEHALALCQSIAKHSPVAVMGTKKALLYARDHSVTDSLEQIVAYNALALQSEDLAEALQAAQQKRPANFQSLPKYSRL